MKLRFFNMIEIMLALAVSAIGITGIMGIIPLGLKANRDAMAETFAADIANSYFADLSIKAANASSFTSFANDDIKFPAAAKTSVTVDGNTVYVYKNPTTPKPSDWEEDGKTEFQHQFTNDGVDFDTSNMESKHYLRVFVGKKDGSNKVLPDFAADVCGWKCYPDDIAGAEGAQTDLVRVYLEVSWPVFSPYAEREKRTFVREFYNTEASSPELEPAP